MYRRETTQYPSANGGADSNSAVKSIAEMRKAEIEKRNAIRKSGRKNSDITG